MKRYIKSDVGDGHNIVIDDSTIHILTDIDDAAVDWNSYKVFGGDAEFSSIDGEEFDVEFRYMVEMPVTSFDDGCAYLIDDEERALEIYNNYGEKVPHRYFKNINILFEYIENDLQKVYEAWENVFKGIE